MNDQVQTLRKLGLLLLDINRQRLFRCHCDMRESLRSELFLGALQGEGVRVSIRSLRSVAGPHD